MVTGTPTKPDDRTALALTCPVAPPPEMAACAGLHYVDDSEPGIRRMRDGEGFEYVSASGEPVRDPETLERIAHLAIPPAWTDVWICADADGHVQATGRDARGRKQYRYHARWREVRDETKFYRLVAFGDALPAIRARVERDLSARNLGRERVVALVVRLLDETLIRVGNAEYEHANCSYGLTTLEDRHVEISGDRLRFTFRGKSGKDHIVGVRDARLARAVKRTRDLPGQQLFQFVDANGTMHPIGSSDVNEYLRETTAEDFTSKDFRTWGATVIAAVALSLSPLPRNTREAEHHVLEAVRVAAGQLGNTPAVCRRSYIHPYVIASYLAGALPADWERAAAKATAREGLREDEAVTLELLREAT